MSLEIRDREQSILQFERKEYPKWHPVKGDAAITEEVIKNIAEHIILIGNTQENRQLAAELKAAPITLDKCLLTQTLIDRLPTIFVVPNHVNRHVNERSFMICWERSLTIAQIQQLGMRTEHISLAFSSNRCQTIPILTVAATGQQALRNYTQALRDPPCGMCTLI